MLKVIDNEGNNIWFGLYEAGARKWLFEKFVSEGKPVPEKDVEFETGNKLKIFTPHLVPSKLALSNCDKSGIETDTVLTIMKFKLPPTIITINTAGDGIYKITYIPNFLVADRGQWVLTKTRDFCMGVGTFEISPIEQEQNCFYGNNLKFSPGETGCERVVLSRNAESVFTIEEATEIIFDWLL